jgi:hypothetical protein
MAKHEDQLEQRWATIREKLAANERWLIRQGALVRKRVGHRVWWTVRFEAVQDGRRICRSVSICKEGDTELLQRYRSQARWPVEVAGFARMVGAFSRFMQRRMPALTQAASRERA